MIILTDLKRDIEKTVCEILGIYPDHLVGDINVFDVAQVIKVLESKYQIHFPREQIKKTISLNRMIEYTYQILNNHELINAETTSHLPP